MMSAEERWPREDYPRGSLIYDLPTRTPCNHAPPPESDNDEEAEGEHEQ